METEAARAAGKRDDGASARPRGQTRISSWRGSPRAAAGWTVLFLSLVLAGQAVAIAASGVAAVRPITTSVLILNTANLIELCAHAWFRRARSLVTSPERDALDGAADARLLRHPFLARRVRPGAGIAARLLATCGTLAWLTAFDRLGATPLTMVVASVPAATLLVFVAWVSVRGGVMVRMDHAGPVLGERFRVFVATTPGAPHLEDADVALRCVRRSVGRGFPSQPTDAVLWEISACPAAAPGPDEFVEVDVGAVLANLPSSSGTGTCHVLWELEVTGRTRWGRISEVFVVPVVAAATAGGRTDAPAGATRVA